ncbi:anti-sigma-28 factor, FlgM family [Caloramator quimbayensis]|uniref:Anti-sigma-28 factor, FlgM family n=1 Tax=Caloramator quimbayensis TaxID=1147123 RepID=A0A1T4X959_9CLOT|nr:flagellar biosynthesis anti-sigma factor FlgM [Caloramator quimbayensis]SKA86144.1 anti-sigma-28 factor, FlgM family [Caloramator quimbayensis]
MKVNNSVNRVLNIYSKSVNNKSEQLKKTNKKDTIEISSKGRELQKYIEIIKNTELKSSRADEIKNLLDNGCYCIDENKIASGIIEYIKESDV